MDDNDETDENDEQVEPDLEFEAENDNYEINEIKEMEDNDKTDENDEQVIDRRRQILPYIPRMIKASAHGHSLQTF